MLVKRTNGRVPNFIIIGAGRSGTTTLYQYLCKHPAIFMPRLKEPEYFSSESMYARGIEWYRALFAEARADQLVGEGCTSYTKWPHTLDSPRLIAEVIPDVKMIYLMRHPVERTYSHYTRFLLRQEITGTFEEALEKDAIFADTSMYIRQIERYLRFFPRERFLFLFTSQLKSEPQTVLRKIEEFLGIEEIDLTSDGIITANPINIDLHIRLSTTVRLRKIPPFSLLARLLPKSMRDALYRILIKNRFVGRRLDSRMVVHPLRTETRKRLIELFEEPNQELEKFLGVRLDSWRS